MNPNCARLKCILLQSSDSEQIGLNRNNIEISLYDLYIILVQIHIKCLVIDGQSKTRSDLQEVFDSNQLDGL